MYMYLSLSIYIYIYVYICMYMYVCVYVCIYIYKQTHGDLGNAIARVKEHGAKEKYKNKTNIYIYI